MTVSISGLKDHNLKEKAAKGAGANIVGKLIGLLCQTFGVVILARLLTPNDFGLVSMVTAFSLWIMNFGANGFTEYIIQKEEINNDEVTSLFWTHVIFSIIFAVGFSFFGSILVIFYGEAALSRIAVAMASSFIFQALFTIQFALLKREMKFTLIAVIELTAVFLSYVLAVALALGGMSYWAIVVRQLAISAVPMIAVWFLTPWRPNLTFNLRLSKPGLKYALKIYCNYTLGYFKGSIDRVLLGKFHGSEVLGNYDRASYLSSMPSSQILVPLHNVALATLSRIKNDRVRYVEYYLTALSMISFVGTCSAVALTVVAQNLIPFVLGSKWSEAGRVVMAFGPGIAAYFVYGTTSWLFLSLGEPGRWLKWNLFSTFLTAVGFMIGVPYGAIGMAIAYSAVFFILILPGLWYAGRTIQLRIGAVVSAIWTYFVSGTFVTLTWFYALENWLALSGYYGTLPRIFQISMSLSITVISYAALVVILQRSLQPVTNLLTFIRILIKRE